MIGLIAKLLSSGRMIMFDRLSFGISASVVILSSAAGQLMHESSPQELQRRITSRTFRMGIRIACGLLVMLVALLPMTVLSDTSWLILSVIIVLIAVTIEWVGRVRKKQIRKFKRR